MFAVVIARSVLATWQSYIINMKLSIHSLKSTLYDGKASKLSIPTRMGEITILNHHRALITLLQKGIARIVNDKNEEKFFPVKGGFLEVKPNNSVTVLVEE